MLTSSTEIGAQQIINRLYDRMNLRAPHIIHCESPWQLLLIPLILPVLLRGKQAGLNKDRLLEKIMPALQSDPKLQLWHRLWLRLDSASDELAHFGLLDLEHLLVADDDEVEGLLKPSREASVANLLRADLTRRVQGNHADADPKLDGESLLSRVRSMLIDGYEDVLNRYLLGMYGLYLPADPQSNSMCSSNVVRFRPHELCACFFHTSLSRIIKHIQFLEIGSDGCACLLFPHCCIVLENATVLNFDLAGRLNCDAGPALTFSDGYAVYGLEGSLVKREMVENPRWVTPKKIYNESNQEIRRLMLIRYGIEKFLVDSNAQKVHVDDFGVLFKKQLPDEEPLTFVKVVNSTADQDGTYRDYFLRVPPWIETAHGAIAWTFGLVQDEYSPVLQT